MLRAIACLPFKTGGRLGALIGMLLYLIAGRMRKVAQINIARCMPHLDKAVQHALVRAHFIELGKSMAEMGPLWLWDGDKILNLVKHVSGLEDLKRAHDLGRGIIIAAPHLGAWEMVGLYCSNLYPMTSLYRPPKVIGLDNFIRQGRQKCRAKLVPTDTRGIRAVYEALGRKELIGILPDQDPGGGQGIFAPFFGIPANTMVLLSRLAMRSGAPVFFTYAERLPDHEGFHLHFVQAPAVINNGPVAASVSAVNATIEQCVQRIPQQYLWSYKRFKTRPPGEERFY